MLLHFASARRKLEDRAKAATLAKLFAERVLSAGADQSITETPPDCAKDLCQTQPVVDGVCACMLEAAIGVKASSQTPPSPQSVVPLRLASLSTSLSCAGVRAWVHAVLSSFALHVFEGIESRADLKWHKSADAAVAGLHKRRRVDPHIREFALVTATQTGEAASTSMAVRSLDGVDPSKASRWQVLEMAAYLSSCRLTTSKAGALSIALDASRLGKPARDFLLAVCTDLRRLEHYVLAPQAPRVLERTGGVDPQPWCLVTF